MDLPLHFGADRLAEYRTHQNSHLRRLEQIKNKHGSGPRLPQGVLRAISNHQRDSAYKMSTHRLKLAEENRRMLQSISLELRRTPLPHFRSRPPAVARRRQRSCLSFRQELDNIKLLGKLIAIESKSQGKLESQQFMRQHKSLVSRLQRFSKDKKEQRSKMVKRLGLQLPVIERRRRRHK